MADILRQEILRGMETVVQSLRDCSKVCETDEHLVDTPRRMANALLDDYFWGLWADENEVFQKGVFQSNLSEMVMMRHIDFISFCAHHFVPFVGHAYVAYIPEGKLIGLSKIPRVIDVLSHRPQVQERLTEQIADCLELNLKPKGVGVLVEAEHFCIAVRGVKKAGTLTRTTALRGCFREAQVKAEFMAGIPM